MYVDGQGRRGAGMAAAALMTLLCLVYRPAAALPSQINVLGLFDSGSPGDIQAFENAIDEINNSYDCLHGSKLNGIKIIIYPGDSFKAAKEVCYNLETMGAAAVVGPQVSLTTSRHIQSLCHSLQVPHLEGRWSYPVPSSWTREKFTANFYPTPPDLNQAYIALIKEWNAKAIAVIYEDNDGLIRLQEALTDLREPKVHLAQLPNDPNRDYRPFLKMIKMTMRIRHLVIDCRAELIRTIMDQANQIGLVSEYFSFMFTSLDLHTVDFTPYQIQQGRVNITGFRLLREGWRQSSDSCAQGQDWRTNMNQLTTTSMLMYDALHSFARALRTSEREGPISVPTLSCDTERGWGTNGSQIIRLMLQTPMMGRSGLIRLSEFGRRDDFELDVLELGAAGLEVVGSWSRAGGVNYTRTWGQKTEEIATSMSGRTFRVVVGLANPYVMEDNTTESGFSGFCIDLMGEIAKKKKFKVEYHVSPNNQYGTFSEKEGPSGMMKELMENAADMAIADLSITLDREKGVDFSMPWMNLGISILYRKPVKAPPQLFSFMGPLSTEVWIYMGTAYLGVSVLLFILARLAPEEWDNPNPCIEDPDVLENQFTMLNSLWFTIGSLMQQGSEIAPKAVSTRMVAAWWWVFTLIMISSYTANLAAFLTAGRMETPIKSAEDLAKQTTIKYGAKKTGSTKYFFRDSSKELYRRMYNFMESARPTVYVDSSDAGVERVIKSKGLYAYLMESSGIEYVLERNCELTQVGGLLDHKSYGIALQPGSPYTTVINSAILEIQEEGRLLELKNRWWKANTPCPDDNKVNANELGIDNVGGVFVVLLGGMCVAVLIAFSEFIWKSRKLAHAEHTSLMNEMAKELKFAFSCKGSSKPVSKPEPLRPSQSATYLSNGPGNWNADVTFEPYQRKP
ncbi:glutamate receptor ionotropic, kainate 2-like isoform X2 [Amphibalanus amphitrite]|uniref:glutamate receptor ionotropic, kainate 2-like isoform X2 n=1 Tax=Amphibalanus amphitrite TaxID=1232801 RepID=UPI001C9148A5|nr:glutamate receptor ionotropic, kainate 2-like isoform X2 [Amphibalanus amphitrite]